MTANISIELFRYALEQMVEKKDKAKTHTLIPYLPSPQQFIIWR